jgi:hypothetical protein
MKCPARALTWSCRENERFWGPYRKSITRYGQKDLAKKKRERKKEIENVFVIYFFVLFFLTALLTI